jgi:Pyruvate/2-oxoacid:ferredoxin oxidoreductase gamma subunit
MINENGGWSNCEMIPIDKIMVRDKIEARIREEELRLFHKANMNSIKAYIDEKNKKGDLVIYNKQYVQNHYEHLQDLWKKQYEKNKSDILESRAKSYQYKKAWKELCSIEL